MEDNKFYTVVMDDDWNVDIVECNVFDTERVIIEFQFRVYESDMEEDALYYVKNGNIYCCSWYYTMDKQEKPFKIK